MSSILKMISCGNILNAPPVRHKNSGATRIYCECTPKVVLYIVYLCYRSNVCCEHLLYLPGCPSNVRHATVWLLPRSYWSTSNDLLTLYVSIFSLNDKLHSCVTSVTRA